MSVLNNSSSDEKAANSGMLSHSANAEEEQASVLTSVDKGVAAVTVQKLYRSYHTRRNLADTAVIAGKFGWWNVIEGALLCHDSTTFYAFDKHDTVASRWSRLQKKASKVGKGLSKDDKALKLAVQHWLEAVDPRHRYGHNLHIYYEKWMESSTTQPFFYWLDIGEGMNLDLSRCKRSKLQQEQIKYLGPKEREKYEVIIEDGKLVYKETKELVNTPKVDKWIFVMSTSGRLYVAQKKKGKLQHSSFLAGGATTAAGRLIVTDGVLELMEAHSGHYQPTEENFKKLVDVLKQLGTDLTFAKVQSVSDDFLPSNAEKLTKTSSEANEAIVENTMEVIDESNMVTDPTQAISSTMERLHIEMLPKLERPPSEALHVKAAADSDYDDSQEKLLAKESIQIVSPVQKEKRKLYRWSSGAGVRISSLLDVPNASGEGARISSLLDVPNGMTLQSVDRPLSSPCEVN